MPKQQLPTLPATTTPCPPASYHSHPSDACQPVVGHCRPACHATATHRTAPATPPPVGGGKVMKERHSGGGDCPCGARRRGILLLSAEKKGE